MSSGTQVPEECPHGANCRTVPAAGIPIRLRIVQMEVEPPTVIWAVAARFLLPRQVEDDRTSMSHQVNRDRLVGSHASEARSQLSGEVARGHLGQGSPGLHHVERVPRCRREQVDWRIGRRRGA